MPSRTSENIEEHILSQEDEPALEIHRTMHHFGHINGIIANVTFPYWKLLF